MFESKLNVASFALIVASGALLIGAQPVLACHEATGWCCQDDDHVTESDDFCCYFDDNAIQPRTCG